MSSHTLYHFFIPLLGFILLSVNFIFAPHNPYKEKNGTFECGYTSFLGQNRTQFSISFFIFALLFLLFDLEILLVYPYLVSSYVNESYGLVILLVFLAALTLGFVFELGKKALTIDSKQTLLNNTSIVNINAAGYFGLIKLPKLDYNVICLSACISLNVILTTIFLKCLIVNIFDCSVSTTFLIIPLCLSFISIFLIKFLPNAHEFSTRDLSRPLLFSLCINLLRYFAFPWFMASEILSAIYYAIGIGLSFGFFTYIKSLFTTSIECAGPRPRGRPGVSAKHGVGGRSNGRHGVGGGSSARPGAGAAPSARPSALSRPIPSASSRPIANNIPTLTSNSRPYLPPVTNSGSYVPPVTNSGSYVPPVTNTGSHVPPITNTGSHLPPITNTGSHVHPGSHTGSHLPPVSNLVPAATPPNYLRNTAAWSGVNPLRPYGQLRPIQPLTINGAFPPVTPLVPLVPIRNPGSFISPSYIECSKITRVHVTSDNKHLLKDVFTNKTHTIPNDEKRVPTKNQHLKASEVTVSNDTADLGVKTVGQVGTNPK